MTDTRRPATAAPQGGAHQLIVLGGDAALRPPSLERDLLRAGFQMMEAGRGDLPEHTTAVLHATASLSIEAFTDIVAGYDPVRSDGAMIILLLHGGRPEHLIRAAEAGADEAILLPAESEQLMARVRARLVAPWGAGQSHGGPDLKLFNILQAVAVELSRDEMLHALGRSLSLWLDIQSVSILLMQPGASNARLVTGSEMPRLRDLAVSADQWPEAVAAVERGSTLHIRNVAVSPLFAAVTDFGVVTPGRQTAVLVSTAAIPMYSQGRVFGCVVLRSRGDIPALSTAQVALAEQAVAATARLIDSDDRRGAIARRQALAAHIDPLTGCATLDALDRRIRDEFERSSRYGVTFAVVLIDVDGMRFINEQLGREGGHRVLAELGLLFQRELRGPDFVARYGGEEFLLLLPETDLEGGRRTVERIRERQQQLVTLDFPEGLQCSLTAGVAIYPDPEVHKPEDLFARVETALLKEKHRAEIGDQVSGGRAEGSLPGVEV